MVRFARLTSILSLLPSLLLHVNMPRVTAHNNYTVVIGTITRATSGAKMQTMSVAPPRNNYITLDSWEFRRFRDFDFDLAPYSYSSSFPSACSSLLLLSTVQRSTIKRLSLCHYTLLTVIAVENVPNTQRQ